MSKSVSGYHITLESVPYPPLARIRSVYVPDVISDLYRRKPIATLEQLLKIAETATAEDSRDAAAIAYAVGQRPLPGEAFAFVDLDMYDAANKATHESSRARFVKLVKERIAKLTDEKGEERQNE